MDNQEKKRYLMRCMAIEAEVRDLALQRQRWRELGESVTQAISDMPRSSGVGDKVGRAAAQIAAIDTLILDKLDELTREYDRIERCIEAVEDETLRRVLRLRYLGRCTWEAIAVEMGFSYRHTVRLHGEALTAVKIDEECEN